MISFFRARATTPGRKKKKPQLKIKFGPNELSHICKSDNCHVKKYVILPGRRQSEQNPEHAC